MKRLRENAMLEAEISVNGDVFVEGHHVGQLAGFRFTLANAAEGQEAKAMLSAAQKALALEFEARAARLHAAGNGDLAVTSEGVVRWLGDPVARLTSTDHILHPRVILLADEQLTGPARDHVAARIERFVNHHIATVLKPLDDLSRAEDLEGLAKGLAFQLVENLGVLFRRDVAEEVKSLSQEHRAALRKLGVRFGAYHVFMPALLKPAPAELITLLWALKNDAMDKPGYGDLIPVLAAGRTSVVTDHAIERNFYRLAGFRFLGKRAVRIDILERLADLIRPLLQWKPETGKRPDGAYDGRRFVTTPAMLSILGATPDDMEEILKGLGYRADSVTAEEAATFLAAQDAKVAPAEGAAAPTTAEASTEDDTADSDAGHEQEEQPQRPPLPQKPHRSRPPLRKLLRLKPQRPKRLPKKPRRSRFCYGARVAVTSASRARTPARAATTVAPVIKIVARIAAKAEAKVGATVTRVQTVVATAIAPRATEIRVIVRKVTARNSASAASPVASRTATATRTVTVAAVSRNMTATSR